MYAIANHLPDKPGGLGELSVMYGDMGNMMMIKISVSCSRKRVTFYCQIFPSYSFMHTEEMRRPLNIIFQLSIKITFLVKTRQTWR